MRGRNKNKRWCKYDDDEKYKTLAKLQKLAKSQFGQRQTEADIYYTKDEEDGEEDKDEEEATASGQDEEANIDNTLDLSIKSRFLNPLIKLELEQLKDRNAAKQYEKSLQYTIDQLSALGSVRFMRRSFSYIIGQMMMT